MPARYNPPPNWPDQPAGWTPPPDWEPDPSWGPPPYGWQLWLEDSPPPRAIQRRHLIVLVGFVIGISALLGYVYLFSARSDDASTMTSDPDTPVPPHTNARGGSGIDDASNGSPADQDPAPYAAEPQAGDAPPTTTTPGSDQPARPSQHTTPTTPNAGQHQGSTGAGSDRSYQRRPDRLDPRFPDCERARAAGYGPYQLGQNLEYFWYPDPNHDGIVCGGYESAGSRRRP